MTCNVSLYLCVLVLLASTTGSILDYILVFPPLPSDVLTRGTRLGGGIRRVGHVQFPPLSILAGVYSQGVTRTCEFTRDGIGGSGPLDEPEK